MTKRWGLSHQGGGGYAVGQYLAFAYIPPELNKISNELEVLVYAKPRRAVVSEKCSYDKENRHPRQDD